MMKTMKVKNGKNMKMKNKIISIELKNFEVNPEPRNCIYFRTAKDI